MSDDRKMPFAQAWRLQRRAMKDTHKLDRCLLPSIALSRIVSAVTPYVLVYFSAQILNELSTLRRADVLWTWVWLTVGVGGVMALLKALLSRWENVHQTLTWHKIRTMYVYKLFTMDYADVDKPATHDLRAQIDQSANWMGWGFPRVPRSFSGMVEACTGIISAVVLTASLFTAQVPDSAGAMTVLNSPLFIMAILAVMLLLSALSSKLSGHADALEAALADKARLGNRLFGYFGFFGSDRQNADIRMYRQFDIAQQYFEGTQDQSFGVHGPFARLMKGRGGVYNGVASGLSAVFTGAIYLFTCLKALYGAFGVGSITQYVGAATALSGSMTQLFTAFSDIRNNGRFLAQCYAYLDIPNAMYQGTLTTEKRSDRQYQVEFRDVSFKYPGADSWALRHVSVKLNIGSRMAIVGENGSGKTTFIKLLCRLYDPQEGEILLNGIDIKKYNYREYMNIFALVFQDFQLLSQPLSHNVAGSADYDEVRVKNALRDAGFAQRLKTMPHGLDTLLYREYDDEGVSVSGGEAQKIAIARALYLDAPFLVLDEPTAALDPMAEAEIYAQLNQIVGDRTAIYISHRLSSCRFCDEILVFDQGRIAQMGTHDQLLANTAGQYHALWNAQAQYYTNKV